MCLIFSFIHPQALIAVQIRYQQFAPYVKPHVNNKKQSECSLFNKKEIQNTNVLYNDFFRNYYVIAIKRILGNDDNSLYSPGHK